MQGQQRSRLLLMGLAFIGFISLGLPDGLHGVAWPSIRESFALPLDALGQLLVVFTLGYLLASFSSGMLLARISVGALLAFSCLATAISLLVYALAPGWRVMVGFGALAGLGAGAIDAGLNMYAATHFSARMVNWLHACYGVGATSGPVLMTGVLAADYPWRWGYAVVGLGQLLLAVCFSVTRQRWTDGHASQATASSTGICAAASGSTLRLPGVWLSSAVFFLYTGIEIAAGTWSYSLFTEARAMPMLTAGLWVSIYWGIFTVGRIIAGLITDLVSTPRLLRGCMVGMVLGALLIWLNPSQAVSCCGLALMGLASAPVFPSLIATTPGRLGAAHTANAVGFQIAAAVLGQALLPSVLGRLASTFGLEMVGPGLCVAALLLLALYEALTAHSARRIPQASVTTPSP